MGSRPSDRRRHDTGRDGPRDAHDGTPGPADLPTLSLELYDTRHPRTTPRHYHVGAENGLLRTEPGTPTHPTATVTADATTWSEVLFSGLALADAERTGLLRLEGDQDVVARVAALFSQTPHST